MKDIHDIQRKMQADSGFKTPDNYFESIEGEIEARIQECDAQKNGSLSIVRALKPVLALAACFLLGIVLFKYPASLIDKYAQNNAEQELNYMIEEAYFEDEIKLLSLFALQNEQFVEEVAFNANSLKEDELLSTVIVDINDVEILAHLLDN